MKTRSHAFLNYLSETGVLNGTSEQTAAARLAYRKIYKRLWKQQRTSKKEIRIEFTLEQFVTIQQTSAKVNLTPTAFTRNVILSAIDLEKDIKRSPELLNILQLISMLVNSSVVERRQDHHALIKIETLLLQYLNVI